MSQPSIHLARDLAIWLKVGSFLTSSSWMPWMREASSEICIVGLILRVLTSVLPSGMTLTMDISTIRSVATLRPVLSMSKKIMGFLRLSFILCEG